MEGAADTTRIFMRSLILMLVAFPEVQVKAQEQIDALVGPDRVPLLDDYEQLPYVQAIVKEVSKTSILIYSKHQYICRFYAFDHQLRLVFRTIRRRMSLYVGLLPVI